MTRSTVLSMVPLLLLACGETIRSSPGDGSHDGGSDVPSTDAGTGGDADGGADGDTDEAAASGGKVGSGGSSGGAECQGLAEAAGERFYGEIWKARLSCEEDSNCVEFPALKEDCFSICWMHSGADTEGVEAAIAEACAEFDEARCEPRTLPCQLKEAPTCVEGTCTPGKWK